MALTRVTAPCISCASSSTRWNDVSLNGRDARRVDATGHESRDRVPERCRSREDHPPDSSRAIIATSAIASSAGLSGAILVMSERDAAPVCSSSYNLPQAWPHQNHPLISRCVRHQCQASIRHGRVGGIDSGEAVPGIATASPNRTRTTERARTGLADHVRYSIRSEMPMSLLSAEQQFVARAISGIFRRFCERLRRQGDSSFD